MRKNRQKISGEKCYYHLMSRISGSPGEYPFGDVEKEYAFTLLADLSKLYFLEVISFCAMGNHWHLIVHDPDVAPTNKNDKRGRALYYFTWLTFSSILN